MSIRQDIKIFGAGFWLLSLPVLAREYFRKEPQMTTNQPKPEPTDIWHRVELCQDCDRETEQEYLLWQEDEIVTRECLWCDTVVEVR